MKTLTLLRKQRRLTQGDVALAVNASRAGISAIERGVVAPDAARHGTVRALENLFGMPIDRLLSEIHVSGDGNLQQA